MFWKCEIAREVRSELQKCMPVGSAFIMQKHVWLLTPPKHVGIPECVWEVTMLAVISAIERAHRYLTRLGLRQHDASPDEQDEHNCTHLIATDSDLMRARMAAVENFWSELLSFTSLYTNRLPKNWPNTIECESNNGISPFISIQTNSNGEEHLCINRL